MWEGRFEKSKENENNYTVMKFRNITKIQLRNLAFTYYTYIFSKKKILNSKMLLGGPGKVWLFPPLQYSTESTCTIFVV